MKNNQPANWIRIALLCLALAFAIILVTIPLLAKVVSHITGSPVEPQKLDIRPIPVPVAPVSFVINDQPVSATPAPALAAIDAVPIPTPSGSEAQTGSVLAQASPSGRSTRLPISLVNQRSILIVALICLVLLLSIWLHRMPNLHSLNGKSAS